MVYKVFYHDSTRRDLATAIDSVVWEFAAAVSDVDENSTLGRVNRNDSTVVLTETFIRAVRNMQRMDSLTGGYLKMNVSDLKVRWGLHGKKLKTGWRAPDQQEIDSFLRAMKEGEGKLFSGNASGDQKYWLNNIKIQKNSSLDLSPVLRGLLVDMIAEFLELEGIENYSVQVDQVIRTSGVWKKKRWQVGIERPDLTEPIAWPVMITLKDSSVATCGFSRKAISTPAGDFLPFLNPKTGHPVPSGFFCYSVIAEDATTADALSTALTIMGKDSAMAFAKRMKLEFYYQERGEDERYHSDGTFPKSRIVEDSVGTLRPATLFQ